MKSELSLPRTDAYFKYPMEGVLGIYATAAFMQVQGELRDFKWTYLLVGAQYLAQRWREVNLSNDIRRLQFYITGSVSKGQRPPRTALRAMHATYKRIRKVYDMDLRLEPRNPYDYRDSRNYW